MEKVKNYSVESLKAADRHAVSLLDKFTASALSAEQVDKYLDERIAGRATRELYAEILKPFAEYLREQAEYFKVDLIIERNEHKRGEGSEG